MLRDRRHCNAVHLSHLSILSFGLGVPFPTSLLIVYSTESLLNGSHVLSMDVVCRLTRFNRSVLSNWAALLFAPRRVILAARVSAVSWLHLTTMPVASGGACSENEVTGDEVSTPLENGMTLGLHPVGVFDDVHESNHTRVHLTCPAVVIPQWQRL